MSDTRLLGVLRSAARAHREILALYLFGSRATGTSGPLSDLDLAVLLDEDRVTPAQWFDQPAGTHHGIHLRLPDFERFAKAFARFL